MIHVLRTFKMRSFKICGRLLSKSEINSASTGLPTMRMLIGYDAETVVGVAFQEVSAKLYPKLQVNGFSKISN